jgi:DNA modification methylase
MAVEVIHGDSRDVLKTLAPSSVDSVCCDPPYALVSIVKRFGKPGAAEAKGNDAYMCASSGFMGQQWDTGETAFDPDFWREVLRVLKPGGHLVAFSGTRTYHRMAVAIEDAGFEIRDMLQWLYGSGFPKSHNVGKGIDKHAGTKREVIGRKVGRAAAPIRDIRGGGLIDDRPNTLDCSGITAPATEEAAAWEGWGTALKPAVEPICLARKPLSEKTIAANVLKWGTGALNIDGCRIEAERPTGWGGGAAGGNTWDDQNCGLSKPGDARPVEGRFPANVLHDGSDEVLGALPDSAGQTGLVTGNEPSSPFANVYRDMPNRAASAVPRGDSGSAARFFYSAKADSDDRFGSKHPTVKPVDLMRWLCRLVTTPAGTVLDPFAGSGTTGAAAIAEGLHCILIEREAAYVADIRERISYLHGEGRHSAVSKARSKRETKGTLI